VVFSSYIFLFCFLPFALLLYYAALPRWRNGVLLGVSYLFYGWTNPLFVLLLLFSTVIDYTTALIMDGQLLLRILPKSEDNPAEPSPAVRRTALVTSLCAQLGILGFFKYFNFATENWDALVAFLGLPDLKLGLVTKVILPLGISFYTFQTMSYTIDVYRRNARALTNFSDFACYVAMFPQLVAGPIVRFSHVADQLKTRVHSVDKFARGVAFVCLGLAKKVLLANPCGKIATTAFDAQWLSAIDAWVGAVAYAFQIYFDFSGYSDMAIGLGLMMGFMFRKNFNSPYLAESITDFWRRWHISLSSWLRDYLYIPLGGNRAGPVRTYVSLGLVMLLGGVWHGAGWTFVAWGGLHGLLLISERFRGKRSLYAGLPRSMRIGLTFSLVLVGWVFFRASDIHSAVRYLTSMAGMGTYQSQAHLFQGIGYLKAQHLVLLAICGWVVWRCPQTWDWTEQLSWRKAAGALTAACASIVVLAMQPFNPFIYFIF
jgi:alginate O-acetyltransferase complex protein AlgI